ncbi:MAG: hypothetical protein KH354_05745 [Clostridiales bacterium]|nr:hypothetical protein [Clostridiales bacterium]
MNKNKFIAALLVFACALIYTGRHVMLLAGMAIDTRFFFGLTWFLLLFTQAVILYVRFAERTDGAGKVSRWVAAALGALTFVSSCAAFALGIGAANVVSVILLLACLLSALSLAVLTVCCVLPKNCMILSSCAAVLCVCGAAVLLVFYDGSQMIAAVQDIAANIGVSQSGDAVVFYAIFSLFQIGFSVLAHGMLLYIGAKTVIRARSGEQLHSL